MLTIKDLEEFEEQLKSGAVEDQFEYAGEERRYEILELLDKLMDVADEANEVATRLIYKGSVLEAMAGPAASKDQK